MEYIYIYMYANDPQAPGWHKRVYGNQPFQNRRDGPSGYIKPPTGADFEKVDCLYPHPPPQQKEKKSEPMILRSQGDKRVYGNQPFQNRRDGPSGYIKPPTGADFEKVDCLYPHPTPHPSKQKRNPNQ